MLPRTDPNSGLREWIGLACLALVSIAFAASSAQADDPEVDYLRHVKPILRERCYTCHGALKQKGHLRLDTVAFLRQGGDSGPAIEQEDAESSLLLERVTAHESERMPPKHEGDALSSEQIALIRQWVASGAPAPVDEAPEEDTSRHWAFQPIVRPAVPTSESAWVRNPIDAFLERGQRQHGLTPQPEASRGVLLRRLDFDLLGVPPSVEEIEAAERDDAPDWYERKVERLLGDPRHGERWARHWMDVWRYSDWWGLGDQLRNSQKHIWHWRDWIVESLNQDLPYDEMVRLMLAADELHPEDLGKIRATGYLARNSFLFNRVQWMDETVEHVSKGFLGLTMNCARCHDHKFDPIEHADYYRMRAFFEPYHVRLDMVPGETNLERDGIPRIYDGVLDAPTYRYVRGDEKNPDTTKLIAPGVPEILAFDDLRIKPVTLPPDAAEPERRPWVLESYLQAGRSQVDAAEREEQKARKALADAETCEPASQAASKMRADCTLAEAAAEVARAELESLTRRAAAQRASWTDATADQLRDLTTAAIHAERLVAVAKARQSVVTADQSFQHAADDQKAAAEKALGAAREALKVAVAASEAEIKSTDTFTRLLGAKWAATRFLNSTADDPAVPFPATSSGRRSALAAWITDRRNPLTARVAVNQIWMRHMGNPLVPTVFDFGRNGTPPADPDLLDWLAAELMDSGWSMKHIHRLIVTSSAYRMSSSAAGAAVAASRDPENRFWWRRVPIRLESQAVRDALLSLSGTLDPAMGGPSILPEQQADSPRRSLYFFHSNNERNLFLTTFDEALVKDCYRREQSIVPQQALALTNSRLVLDASEKIAGRLSAKNADELSFVREAFKFMLAIDAGEAELTAAAQALAAWRKLPGGSDEQARANLIWALVNHNDFVTLR